jgi:hypothetical protein
MKKEDIITWSNILMVLVIFFIAGFAVGMGFESHQLSQNDQDMNMKLAESQQEVVRLKSYLEAYDSAMTIYKVDMYACGCKPSEFIFSPDGMYIYHTKGIEDDLNRSGED